MRGNILYRRRMASVYHNIARCPAWHRTILYGSPPALKEIRFYTTKTFITCNHEYINIKIRHHFSKKVVKIRKTEADSDRDGDERHTSSRL